MSSTSWGAEGVTWMAKVYHVDAAGRRGRRFMGSSKEAGGNNIMEPVVNKKESRKALQRPRGLGIRYSDVDIQKRVEIYNFVMEKVKEMASKNELNLHELSRIAMRNYGVYVSPVTIRDWIIKGSHPLRNPQLNPITKAPRRPPDPQIIPTTLGLLYSDFHFRTSFNTLVFVLTTPYEAFARNVATLYRGYGHVSVAPYLGENNPTWTLHIYLDKKSWDKIFTISPSSLNEEEIRTFLARVIDGDGWLSPSYGKGKLSFYIGIATSYMSKAKLFSELFQKFGYHPIITSRPPTTSYIYGREVKRKRRAYIMMLCRKNDVVDFLRNVRFLHPMREVRRKWALKIINNGVSIERSKKIWRYIYQVEKTARLYSKLKSALILSKRHDISDIVEDLKKKYIESVRLLRQLREELMF